MRSVAVERFDPAEKQSAAEGPSSHVIVTNIHVGKLDRLNSFRTEPTNSTLVSSLDQAVSDIRLERCRYDRCL